MKATVSAFCALLLASCASGTPGAKVERFRSDLAAPEKYALRDGMELDAARFQRAVQEFAVINQDLLQANFHETLSALPVADLPREPEYVKISGCPPQAVAAARQTFALYWAISPTLERTTRLAMTTMLPLMMMQYLKLPARKMSTWVTFFVAAKPDLYLHERSESAVTLIVDYGGQDMFVLIMRRLRPGWAPDSLTWWQRPSGRGAPKKTDN